MEASQVIREKDRDFAQLGKVNPEEVIYKDAESRCHSPRLREQS